MSNNVTVIQPKAALAAGDKPSPIVPTNIEQVWRFAELVAKSGMAPRDMQKPEAITVAIMHGLEIGLTPLMALQRIAVVNGRPTLWGDAAMALVRASGRCEYVREHIEGNGDAMKAVCIVKRRDETEPATSEFSVADARKAGLWDKAGPWKQYPRRMLQMRARAFALRDTFADVLGGLYLREEMEGVGGDNSPRDVTPAREEPPAPPPPPVVAAAPVAETAPVAQAMPATQADALPDAQKDPEAFLKSVDAVLQECTTQEHLETVWNLRVDPHITALFPPDQDEALGLFRKHEKRFAE